MPCPGAFNNTSTFTDLTEFTEVDHEKVDQLIALQLTARLYPIKDFDRSGTNTSHTSTLSCPKSGTGRNDASIKKRQSVRVSTFRKLIFHTTCSDAKV